MIYWKTIHHQLGKRLKNYYPNTNSDSACKIEKGRTSSVRKKIEGILFKYKYRQRLLFRKGEDIFGLERDWRTIIQIQIATALVVSKRGGHLQFGKMSSPYRNYKRCRYLYLNNSPSISFSTEDVLSLSKLQALSLFVFE